MGHPASATPGGSQATAATAGQRGLPLPGARTWAVAFLLFAAVLAQTMPAFFRAAYHLG